MSMVSGSEQLLEVCRRAIDPGATIISCRGTRVLRAGTRLGEVIVKLHHRPERHQQELHAYQHWVSALGDRAPRLLAATDDPPTLVITALPGRLLSDGGLDQDAERDAHHRAGALLRDLHAAGPPRRLPDMTAWLYERGMAWLDATRDIIPARRRVEMAEHMEALRKLGSIPAVPCHLDFTPGNLLRDGDLRLIDFEHARYDLAARDLVRLTTRTWTGRPDLEEAFRSTYGSLTDIDRQVIDHCRHLDDLTRIARDSGRDGCRRSPMDLPRSGLGSTGRQRRGWEPQRSGGSTSEKRMTNLSEDIDDGPPGWRIWRAARAGAPSADGWESLIYTDAHLAGEVTDGFGPFQLFGTMAEPLIDALAPRLVLRVHWHDPGHTPRRSRTKIKKEGSRWLALNVNAEMACLLSLITGCRLRSGGKVRTFTADNPLGRPTYAEHTAPSALVPVYRNPMMPGLAGLRFPLLPAVKALAAYPSLGPHDAVTLVRAARHYSSALWVADSDPEQAWLQLVSALEAAATRWKDTTADPVTLFAEQFQEPTKLIQESAGGDALLASIAPHFVKLIGAGRRVEDFVETFKPPAPHPRPPTGATAVNVGRIWALAQVP